MNRTLPQRLFDRLLRVKPELLNPAPTPLQPDLIARLKTCMNQIKAAAFDPATGFVDYSGLASSDLYQQYRALTAELHHFDLTHLATQEEKLAFWLNLYNLLVIDAVIYYQLERVSPALFAKATYQIGDYCFNLDDIEHGILRCNRGNPFIPGVQFGANDPRRSFILDTLDFRIHFALVCGAASCPPINIYEAEKINMQLDLAIRSFIQSETAVDLDRRHVTLSQIFQWYGYDFGASHWLTIGLGKRTILLPAIAPYFEDEGIRMALATQAEQFKVKFKPYSWSLNSVGL